MPREVLEDEANQEACADIDGECADRKSRPEMLGCKNADKVSGQSSECPAHCNQYDIASSCAPLRVSKTITEPVATTDSSSCPTLYVRSVASDHFTAVGWIFVRNCAPDLRFAECHFNWRDELHDRTTPPQVILRGVIIHNLNIPQAMAVRVNSITLELLD